MTRICVTPAVPGIGGMASFRLKFEAGLQARGLEVTHDLSQPVDSILLIAGTRKLLPLWKARRRGVRIVQRLDGINWVHRKRHTGLKHYLRAEYGNLLLSFIRKRIATEIIYQSQFSKDWWEGWYGIPRAASTVIHNGVDLNVFSARQGESPPLPYKLLVVEANLGGGYEMGLDHAIQLTEALNTKHNLPSELIVFGRISDDHKSQVQSRVRVPFKLMGVVAPERIPEIDHSAHVLFSADLNPACPNSVIEALACSLPVVAFDTGALNEIVLNDSGRLVPYGSDPWQIGRPDIPSLADAAAEILKDQARFSGNARAQAESALGIDRMVDGYIRCLLEG